MADVTNELLYELLKKIQSELSNQREGQRDLRADNLSIRNQLHIMQGDMNGIRAMLAQMDQRIDRIESRLDRRKFAGAGLPFGHQD